MREIRLEFEISGQSYILFIDKGLFKPHRYTLMEKVKPPRWTSSIPVAVSKASFGETVWFLKWKLMKYLKKQLRVGRG